MFRKSPVLVLILLLSLILAACGGGGDTAQQGGEATSAPADSQATAAGEGEEAPASGSVEPSDQIPFIPPAEDYPDLSGQSIKAILSDEGPSADWQRAAAATFGELTGAQVEVITGEQSATDRLAAYLQQLSAQSPDIDVYQIDVIWPGIVAPFAEDLSPALGETAGDHFPAIVENNTVDGKLVGMPWYTDAGLLYYRTDLLEKYGFDGPPETWAELEEMATTIQEGEREEGNADFWGYVWQGNAYEGLTCNALELQASFGGGSIVESDGTVSVNNPQAVAAFNTAKNWVGNISPPGVTTYQEEEARGVWQGGNAAFMRNWPYAFGLGQADDSAIKDNFDVTVLPKGDGADARNADTLGGWQLMVNTYSDNKDAAIEFVKFMTSYEMQKSQSIVDSKLPTRPDLYEDADVLEVNAFYTPLQEVFAGGAIARPSTVTGELYNDVSIAYFTTVNQILTGQADAETALSDLEANIQDILK